MFFVRMHVSKTIERVCKSYRKSMDTNGKSSQTPYNSKFPGSEIMTTGHVF